MDIQEKARENMNWFEVILHKIPGFKGYYEREFRRDADRLQREFIVNKLLEVKNNLNHTIENISRQKNLEQLTAYDLFARHLEKIINEIRYADQGYSGFFDLIKIKETELDSIYRLDSEITELANLFGNESTSLIKSAEQTRLKTMREYLDRINALFVRRTALLKGYQL